MSKISQILRETTIPQVKNAFISFDGDKLRGKCALGVLACESPDSSLHLDRHNISVDIANLFKSYGIEDLILPRLLFNPAYSREGIDWNWDLEGSLSDIIVTLNDDWDFTFKQIADFLEVTFDL